MKDRIAALLAAELPAKAALVVPLALGNHVDHQLTRIAAESLGRPLWYYADFPYILSPPGILAAFDAAGWDTKDFPVDDRAIGVWKAAAGAHKSQLGGFWKDIPEMEESVLSYARSGGGGLLWKRPDFFTAAEDPDVTSNSRYEDGISFCVISNGKRPEKLGRLLTSIRAQGIRSFEIIVAGKARVDGSSRYLPEEEAAADGRLSYLRNRAAASARFAHLAFCDDDILLGKHWYRGLAPDLDKADLITSRIINPDGTRFWDWSSWGLDGQRLLEYGETTPYIYLTGGSLVAKADVWRRTLWNEHLGFGDSEDVDFSFRAVNTGSRLHLCRNACVIHDDWRYTQIGRQVFMRSEEGIRRLLSGRLMSLPRHVLTSIGELKRQRGQHADLADCLRACVQLSSDSEQKGHLDSLLQLYGGNIEGNDDWRIDGSVFAEQTVHMGE